MVLRKNTSAVSGGLITEKRRRASEPINTVSGLKLQAQARRDFFLATGKIERERPRARCNEDQEYHNVWGRCLLRAPQHREFFVVELVDAVFRASLGSLMLLVLCQSWSPTIGSWRQQPRHKDDANDQNNNGKRDADANEISERVAARRDDQHVHR